MSPTSKPEPAHGAALIRDEPAGIQPGKPVHRPHRDRWRAGRRSCPQRHAAQLERFAELVELAYRTVADPVAFRACRRRVPRTDRHGRRATPSWTGSRESLYSLAIDQRRKASQTPGVLDQSARDHDAIVKAIVVARSRRRRGRHGRACRAYSKDDARRARRRRSRSISHKIGPRCCSKASAQSSPADRAASAAAFRSNSPGRAPTW